MPVGKRNQKLPTDILEKLSQLDADLKEEEITIKGYCKRKWALLQKYAPKKVAKDVEKIQTSLANKSTDEKEAYSKMLDLLRTENMFINKRKVLNSTENVVEENDLLEPNSSEPVNDSLKTTILKNYFNKVVNNKNNSPSNVNSNKSNISKRKLPTKHRTKDKRFKTNEEPSPTTTEIASPNINLSNNCDICDQPLDDILKYKGHPKNAVDEFVALTNPKLLLFTGDENDLPTSDQLPNNKITQFTVYDKNGHLCPFDSGLIEKNTLLYFSGYLKPIYDENPSSRGGIPVKDMGPIDEWFTSGFDGGEKALLGFNTAYGIYYLMQPSKEYKPIMEPVWEKIYISKIVIEFLLKNACQNPTYEDLITHLNNCEPPKNISHPTEENLLKNAQFICEQVSNFDSTLEEDDLFIATSCMMSLIKLAGVTLTEQKEIRKEKPKDVKIKNKSKRHKNLSKATTTELVREVFDSFFPEQLDINSKLDCGKCKNCKKAKSGTKDLICLQHRSTTPNGSDTDESSSSTDSYLPLSSSKRILHSVTWLSDPIIIQNGRTYYSSAKVGSEFIKLEDHVMLQPDKTNLPLLIAKIVTMWDHKDGKFFHANIFCRGVHTVLGEISDRREIFQVDDCEDCPLGSIVKKAEVEYKILPPNLNSSSEDDSIFFCQKRYDRKRGRFENLFQDKLNNKVCDMVLGFKPCSSCKRQADKKKYETAVLEDGVVKWRNQIYKPGVGIYLLPGTFEFKTASNTSITEKQIDPIDEDMYPEYYRKKSENIIGIEISEPFCIGYITDILTDLNIQVQKLYRPENTHSTDLSHQLDINALYWSDEEITVPFSKVTGQCHIVFGEILDIPPAEWSSQGPNRFYFLQSYNYKTKEFLPVTGNGRFIGQQGKSRSKRTELEKWGSLEEPLKTMDVFAGCGGLSEGLHQSGVATTKWAIENDKTAALAYKQNNRDTIVYSEDCNDLLTEILSGALTKNGQSLPRQGDVELLVGGPPCQGFSGMNRFNAGQYSLFKNSLIVSYLSYCDYYRPKFFILENVRNFVTFKRSMVLKLTLRCLLAMGYQCAFGVLQAGNYGVPQIRRRSIILAAAPGEILPEYPEPLHVFTSKRANPLDIVIDHCRYNTGSMWLDVGAPFRTITVRDAMSDLPKIQNGCSLQNQKYDSEPVSHFQRVMRRSSDLLQDHICKEMAPLVEARMSYIPTVSGSDWRDLPNIEIKLSDGTTTNKLRYEWHDKRNGKNSKGSFRGVCRCASKKPCDSSSRQYNTLIPWCLPHTANRHNNWAGLYGRLEWDGVFNTTVTNPEPMAKQGRVLHPVQHRVVSVRECARSQGFPDRYRFHGNVMDKHRQVGNAVPPPMGKAIGWEILKCVKNR